MALTVSTEGGLVEVDHIDDGVTLTVAGSALTLSAEHAGQLADYLLSVPDDQLQDVEVEEVEVEEVEEAAEE